MAAARPIRQDGNDAHGSSRAAAGAARITPLRELQLLEQYRKGGREASEALAELIRAYQRRIYSVCIRMVRNPEDAADLTQDSLIKVIEGLPTYNGKSKLSTWVIRVAMNCCLTWLRKQKLRTHENLDAAMIAQERSDAGGAAPNVPESAFSGTLGGAFSGGASGGGRELSPLQRIQQEQTRNRILTALDCLDADSRAILVLRDLQDLDYQQLADVLEVPLGTVKSRLFRARAAFRHALELQGGI